MISSSVSPLSKFTLFACVSAVLTGCGPAGNPISGDGLPNPAPNVTQNWGDLPAGRNWGSTAGIDIDPNDGHIWAYERCGAGTCLLYTSDAADE